jgi:hypothetical protein
VSGVAGTGRSERSYLAIGQIAAENGESGLGKCISQRAEQRGLGVATCTVSENQGLTIGSLRDMQESADVGIYGVVDELANG